jgi:hypothetical protein
MDLLHRLSNFYLKEFDKKGSDYELQVLWHMFGGMVFAWLRDLSSTNGNGHVFRKGEGIQLASLKCFQSKYLMFSVLARQMHQEDYAHLDL